MVGFIALAGIGVYVVYEKVEANNIANKEVVNITTIIAQSKTILKVSGGPDSTGNLSKATMINLGIVPEHMINKDTMTISSTWKGDINLLHNGTEVQIQYFSIPKNVCLKIANRIVPQVDTLGISAASTGLVQIVHNKSATSPIVYDISRAATICNGSNPRFIINFSPYN